MSFMNLTGRQICRRFSTKTAKADLGMATKPNESTITADWIGPPDKVSNLRPVLRHIPQNETNLQRELRERQIAVEKWNNDFWTNHNTKFVQTREEFVRKHQGETSETLDADKMSIFYKEFLDMNLRMHFYYNMSWYLKNSELLTLSAQVFLEKLILRARKKKNA